MNGNKIRFNKLLINHFLTFFSIILIYFNYKTKYAKYYLPYEKCIYHSEYINNLAHLYLILILLFNALKIVEYDNLLTKRFIQNK